ncbi:hypothetical protein OSTOST_23774, partial [Ostertagia ostertagi]
MEEMEKRFAFNASNECVSGTLNYNEWKYRVACSYINYAPIPVYVAILILRRLTISKMNYHTSMSGTTKQLHSQLLKVLTIQACLPMTLFVSTFGYFISQMDIYRNPLIEYSQSFLVVPIPALNALVSLYFIGPYRMWIGDSLSCTHIPPFKLRNSNIVPVPTYNGAVAPAT